MIFVIMAIVLMVRPAGLFGKGALSGHSVRRRRSPPAHRATRASCSAIAVMALLLAIAPFVGLYPVFMMKALCFALFACAFNLLLGFGGLLSFGHADVPRHGRLRVRACGQGLGTCRPSSRILAGTAAAAALGAVVGALAIRRQGIYFAMITLALAQMIYFFFLQAPFTGGEDGIQARAARQAVRRDRPRRTSLTMYYVGARGLHRRLPVHLPRRSIRRSARC